MRFVANSCGSLGGRAGLQSPRSLDEMGSCAIMGRMADYAESPTPQGDDKMDQTSPQTSLAQLLRKSYRCTALDEEREYFLVPARRTEADSGAVVVGDALPARRRRARRTVAPTWTGCCITGCWAKPGSTGTIYPLSSSGRNCPCSIRTTRLSCARTRSSYAQLEGVPPRRAVELLGFPMVRGGSPFPPRFGSPDAWARELARAAGRIAKPIC